MLRARLDGTGGDQDISSWFVVLANGNRILDTFDFGSGTEGVKNRPSSTDAKGVENGPL